MSGPGSSLKYIYNAETEWYASNAIINRDITYCKNKP